MLDDNWESINGPIAHHIEILNAANQINVLNGLLAFLLAHRWPTAEGRPPMPDEKSLCQLHHAGTIFLLAEPGCYRNIEVSVYNEKNEVVHQPPRWQFVPGLMQQFFRHLSSVWTTGDALDSASFALWCINWIHPFRNGNGRTARAFAYACLSLHLGAELPGTMTVIDQIMSNRDRYEEALREADNAVKRGERPDLSKMRAFLGNLLEKQILSADQRSS